MESIKPFQEIKLCAENATIVDFRWNPAVSQTFAIVTTDGAVSVISISEKAFSIDGHVQNENATCCMYRI